MTSLDRASLKASSYDLSDEDIDGLVQFAGDCSRYLGDRLETISLDGEPDAPVISVLFADERQRPGVRYSYEWHMRNIEPPEDMNPLGVLLVDYLGNNIMEDLESTPGLPMWDPDEEDVVHVDVGSERYRTWPQEWYRLGRPWRDQEGHLRYADR